MNEGVRCSSVGGATPAWAPLGARTANHVHVDADPLRTMARSTCLGNGVGGEGAPDGRDSSLGDVVSDRGGGNDGGDGSAEDGVDGATSPLPVASVLMNGQGVVLRKKKQRLGVGGMSSVNNGSHPELDKERPMSWEGELSDDEDSSAKTMEVMSPSPLPSHMMSLDPGSPMSTNGSDREDLALPCSQAMAKVLEENGRRFSSLKTVFASHCSDVDDGDVVPTGVTSIHHAVPPPPPPPCEPPPPPPPDPSGATAAATTRTFFTPNQSPLQSRHASNQSYSSSSSPEQIRHLFYSPAQSPVQARHPPPAGGKRSPTLGQGSQSVAPVAREPLYSPSESPVLSRHLAGQDSPYSSPYSSVSSPTGSIRYSPSHSPSQGRRIGQNFTCNQNVLLPGSASGTPERTSYFGSQPNIPEESFDSEGRRSCEVVDERDGFPGDLGQHAPIAGQSGISRQQLINSPCPVCGDRISGFHYGIFSCESCKGFFKRTVQNKKNYVCLRGASCPITITTRKKCPACRFDKCLKRGMKLEAIREDRTRGGRSTYQCSYALPASACMLSLNDSGLGPSDAGRSQDSRSGDDEADPLTAAATTPVNGTRSPPGNSKSCSGRGAGSHVLHVPELMLEIMQVEHLWHYSEGELQKITEHCDTKPSEADPDFFSNLCNIADHRLYKIVKWCKSLPLFRYIQIDDQICLLLNSWCQLLLLSCCYRSIETPNEIRVSLGKSVTLRQARSLGLGPVIERMLNLTDHFRRLRVDQYEYVCLKVIVLLTSDVAGLKEPEKVRHAQEKVIQALQSYTMNLYAAHPSKFGELLLRIPELERTCQIGKDSLSMKHREGEVPSFNLLMELLRGEH